MSTSEIDPRDRTASEHTSPSLLLRSLQENLSGNFVIKMVRKFWRVFVLESTDWGEGA